VVLALEGVSRIRVGEEAVFNLQVRSGEPLVSTAFQIAYDPKVLKVMEVSEGGALREDGTPTTFSARDDQSGMVSVGVARQGGSGVSGEGTLVQVRVQAIAPAEATPLKVLGVSAIGTNNRVQSATGPAPVDLAVEN
jgi:hypothetical protein